MAPLTQVPHPSAAPKGSVRFVTFGCKANQYDTQVLRETLRRRGWQESPAKGGPAADVVVLNTCTVTAEAGRKARQLIRRIGREEPTTRIAVTGCLAESEPELLRELPNVEWVFGNGEAKTPLGFLRELGEELSPEELGIPAGITEFAGHTRAFLKIQDGCDKACAFCIIPKVRGASRSRPIPELVAEVERLVAAGYREIVLCGIHIGLYGEDLGTDLATLMRAFATLELEAPFRLRLSSIEATEVSDELIELMAARPDRIAPHLHMPLQSGSDRVLRAMNRWYTMDEYLAATRRVKSAVRELALSADILVGFPGEGDEEFAQTLANLREIGFARMHVFPFSPRPGTAAESLPGRPEPAVVRERRAALGELARELASGFKARQVGLEDHVVLEGASMVGLSGRYERVRLVELPAPGPWGTEFGGLIPVRLEAGPGGELCGQPLARAQAPERLAP